MTEQKSEFYERYARLDELKKTARDKFSPPVTEQKDLAEPLRLPSEPRTHTDLPPTGGIIQRRRRGVAVAPIPTNESKTMSGRKITRNHTRRGLTNPNGTDNYILESIEHKGEPLPKDRLKALRLIFSRTAGIMRHTEKNKTVHGK